MYDSECVLSTVITVRVPNELKEDLTRFGVEVSKVTRRALEEEVTRKRREELREAAEELGAFLERIPRERIVGSIREDRGRLT